MKLLINDKYVNTHAKQLTCICVYNLKCIYKDNYSIIYLFNLKVFEYYTCAAKRIQEKNNMSISSVCVRACMCKY